jgi:hypothetical protein
MDVAQHLLALAHVLGEQREQVVTSTSPGLSVRAGNFSKSAFAARGKVRLNTGMARGEWARLSPSESSRSQAKSCASETIRLKPVRHTVCHISSTTVTRRLHMISSETGSASITVAAVASGVSAATRAAGAGGRPISIASDPLVSTRTVSPGGMIVVASRSSMMAGPAIVASRASA